MRYRPRPALLGVLGRGLRFGLVGGAVALLYLTLTTFLAEVVGVSFQLALALGYGTAVVAHFLLQRIFVWAHRGEFALPLRVQVGRYLFVAALQYGSTVAVTATIPAALDVRPVAVYVTWTVCFAIIGFVFFGRGVFHSAPSDRPDIVR